jgi:hypothetical protein
MTAPVRHAPGALDPSPHRPAAGAGRARVSARYRPARRRVFYIGGWERRRDPPPRARSLAAGDRPRHAGRVDDAVLPALDAGALCRADPGGHEGFGLRVSEAMAVGDPVPGARAAGLPAVPGGGETVAPGGPDVPGFRADTARRARSRSDDSPGRRTAGATAAVDREPITDPRRGPPCASAARS